MYCNVSQKCTFFVQLSCMVFFQFVLKIFNFFWYSNGLKENARTFFFSENQKFRKAKCVYKLFISKSKFFKDWIKELLNIRCSVETLRTIKKQFSVKIIPELKIANFQIKILKIFWDSVIQSFSNFRFR